ncbi:hypothetical protein ACU8NW_29990 (plasmid) [Rhizobium leguminosarum]|uniref:hypothetical protein n=1 Tax=Rhizobium TaxID=379 RepID=UPI0010308E0D|nr:hypothetical protein [Rhizobium leguminosarum]TBC90109.1 hypothetical protein ELH21_31715 [Rhizobium leguminosarum]
MSVDYMLLNLDTGDMIAVGKQRTHPAVPEIGLLEEHTFFDGIPHVDHSEGWEELYRRSGHILNFFLAHSRGCRIVVMETEDIADIMGEIEEETGESIMLPGSMHIQNEKIGRPYFQRRLQHTKSQSPKSDAEKEAREKRALQYRDEIKRLIRANVVKIPNKIGELVPTFQAGDMDPDPVFVPWDDRRRSR